MSVTIGANIQLVLGFIYESDLARVELVRFNVAVGTLLALGTFGLVSTSYLH